LLELLTGHVSELLSGGFQAGAELLPELTAQLAARRPDLIERRRTGTSDAAIALRRYRGQSAPWTLWDPCRGQSGAYQGADGEGEEVLGGFASAKCLRAVASGLCLTGHL
jgi:hypothetical protein